MGLWIATTPAVWLQGDLTRGLGGNESITSYRCYTCKLALLLENNVQGLRTVFLLPLTSGE